MNARIVAMAGVVGACLIALVAKAFHSTPTPEAEPVKAPVTAVVRNELGQLKWVATEATDYTPLEAEGRRLTCRSAAPTATRSTCAR